MTEARLSFTPTARHWRWVLETWGARRWLLIRTLALIVVALGLLVGANGYISGWTLAVTGAVLWFTPRLVIDRQVRGSSPVALLPREVVLTADRLEITTDSSQSWYAAALVSGHLVNAGGLLLLSGNQILTFVPRDAVPAEQFESACRLAAAMSASRPIAAPAA